MKAKPTKYPLEGDLEKIKRGQYWICPSGEHKQPKGRLNCIDCCTIGDE